jgi:DNA-binding NtrC family response regulator
MPASKPVVPKPSAPPFVVLIEAEPMLRLTVARFLSHSGYRVTACPDLRTAMGALIDADVRPSLLVLSARTLSPETGEVARRLAEVAPGVPMLGVIDLPGDPATHRLPPGFRLLAPPFDLPDVLRAVHSSLLHAGHTLPHEALLEI